MDFYFARHKELNFMNPESHMVFRKLVEDIKVGIFMSDSLGKLFFVNRSFLDIFHFNGVSDVLGEEWGNICFSDQNRKNQFFVELDNIGVVRDFEIIRPVSHRFDAHLLLTAKSIYSDRGEKIGVYGSIVDISELRRLEEDVVVKNKKLEQILSLCNTLGDIYQIDELNKFIVHETAEILDCKRCSLMFVDSNTNELSLVACCGLPDGLVGKSHVRIGEPVAGIIALQSHAILVDDIEESELFKQPNKEIYSQRSFMGAPLFYNQKLIGVIHVSEKQGRFNRMDLKVLETIAQQASGSINKTRALSTFELLSQTDPMTGLLNYRSFIQKLEEEIARSKRYGSHLSVMMVDVDNFKNYNDSFGHPEGDRLLKRLAEIFKTNLRTTEFICRYGGDEFAVIFPQTEGRQAALAAEKIREIVSKEYSQHHISISVGISQYQPDYTKESLIKKADEALYESKKSGRNQVSLSYAKTA